jgi:hypothetical protein
VHWWPRRESANVTAVKEVGMAKTDELEEFHETLMWELERVVGCVTDAREDVIALSPEAPDANSLAGIATHTLGAAREHILGWALKRKQADDVDRFDDQASAASIRDLFEVVLTELDDAFDELKSIPLETSVATPGRGEQPIRAVLMWAVVHAAEHVGAAELTRGLLEAKRS